MVHCPFCDSEMVQDLGYDDGGGDYGDMITPVYKCLWCGEIFDDESSGIQMPGDPIPGSLAYTFCELRDSLRDLLSALPPVRWLADRRRRNNAVDELPF